MKPKPSLNRYSILLTFICIFLFASFFVRTSFLIISHAQLTITVGELLHIYMQGFLFDLGVSLLLSLLYVVYLLFLPQKWNASKVNKGLTYAVLFILMIILAFTFFAEFAFWLEFESRFNFIAVDYLIYTYEVFNNIKESYPLPLLIGGALIISAGLMLFLKKLNVFRTSFHSHTPFLYRLIVTVAVMLLSAVYIFMVDNNWAEQSPNRYNNELAKAGIYSFFAAYKNNEIDFDQFYKLINVDTALRITRNSLLEKDAQFKYNSNSIRRTITGDSIAYKPNVIMITIESLSADFMKSFGNKEDLTPFLDSLAGESILFTNMFATGSRTIRGMEALSLSVPPTPGSSIVRRPRNGNLYTIGAVFKHAGYDRTFIYGGDGYFDNMNQYFGSNGFDIIDRGRGMKTGDNFKTNHTTIADRNVHFENAWGVCDEDLYDAVIQDADRKAAAGKPFFHFIMTTSNHRPFTYPAGKIDILSGSGREGAVKYTDYAIRRFFSKVKNESWFNNTVFILVADHCANSAGKNEIDISKYHIPCMIFNLQNAAHKSISKMCSQIDLYPTLFHLLGWNYESNFFGRNVLDDHFEERIGLGTYQKLAYLKKDSLVVLGPQQTCNSYIYDKKSNQQTPTAFPEPIISKAIAEYQSAYFLFKKGGLKE